MLTVGVGNIWFSGKNKAKVSDEYLLFQPSDIIQTKTCTNKETNTYKYERIFCFGYSDFYYALFNFISAVRKFDVLVTISLKV